MSLTFDVAAQSAPDRGLRHNSRCRTAFDWSLQLRQQGWVPAQSMEAPVYSGALPSPPTPDPNKKSAVVLTNVCGAEYTDTLPPFEILSRSGIFNVYCGALERAAIPLMPGPARGPSGLDLVLLKAPAVEPFELAWLRVSEGFSRNLSCAQAQT